MGILSSKTQESERRKEPECSLCFKPSPRLCSITSGEKFDDSGGYEGNECGEVENSPSVVVSRFEKKIGKKKRRFSEKAQFLCEVAGKGSPSMLDRSLSFVERSEVRNFNEKGLIPLQVAVLNGNMQNAIFLGDLEMQRIENERDIGVADNEDNDFFALIDEMKFTLLHIAAIQDNEKLLKLLVRRYHLFGLLNCLDARNKTILHYAIVHGNLPMFSFIVNSNAIHLRGSLIDRDDVKSYFLNTIELLNIQFLTILLKKDPLLIDDVDENGWNGLMYCAKMLKSIKEEENKEMDLFFITNDEQNSFRDDKCKNTNHRRDDETAKHSISPAKKRTLLMRTVKILLEKGINTQAKTRDLKKTILHVCAQFDSIEILRLVCRHHKNLDLNQRDIRGLTPLHLSLKHNSKKAASFFILSGCDVELQSFDGETPMMFARRFHSEDVFLDLIECLSNAMVKRYNLTGGPAKTPTSPFGIRRSQSFDFSESHRYEEMNEVMNIGYDENEDEEEGGNSVFITSLENRLSSSLNDSPFKSPILSPTTLQNEFQKFGKSFEENEKEEK